MSQPLPTPSLVVLVGPPASGKSTWATENFAAHEILNADELRGVVGEHELDVAASDDAFEILDRVLDMRLGRGLTTLVDTTGLDAARRRTYLEAAKRHGATSVAVRFATTAAECKRRNRERAHPVPARAIDSMIKLAKAVTLDEEGWDLVIEPAPVRMVTTRLQDAVEKRADVDRAPGEERSPALGFGLLVSRFDELGEPREIGPRLAEVARDAERAGFGSLWVMDHLIQIPQVGRAWDPMLESYSTLAYLAASTSKIRLGVLVSAATFRNVGLLAKTIATLDVLSDGRAIAGIGAGNSASEHDAYGLRFGTPGERLARLEDVLQALPMLWGPGAPSYEGDTLDVPQAVGYPRPLQDPMPIIVGGSGERVTLRLAAEYASGCNLFGDASTVRRRVDALHRHCEAVGRDPSDVEVTHLGEVLVARDPADLSAAVDRLRPSNTGPAKYLEMVNGGTVDDHEAGFRSLIDAGVHTAIVSSPSLTDPSVFPAFTELIARFSN